MSQRQLKSMEKNGLGIDSIIFYLSNADIKHQKIEQSDLSNAYSYDLQKASNLINLAIKEMDIDKLFYMENIAQEFDLGFVKLNKSEKAIEKQEKAIFDFECIEKIWHEGLDPQKVKESHAKTLKLSRGKKVIDRTMDSLIKLQRRNLGVFAGGKTTKAEENFYCSRQKALSLINKEHQKNINKALGIDIVMGKI